MPKRTLRAYNRYVPTSTDLLDVAWKAARTGAMAWEDVQAVQDSLMPDCCVCGSAHAGRILMEKRGYCDTCFKTNVRDRFVGARRERS